jgi:hypothetical protein
LKNLTVMALVCVTSIPEKYRATETQKGKKVSKSIIDHLSLKCFAKLGAVASLIQYSMVMNDIIITSIITNASLAS